MPKRGENIHKRKDGRWEARIITNGKMKSIYADNYRTVKEKQRNYKEIVKESINADTSFSGLCYDWLKTREIKNKPSTIARYSSIIKNHLEPYLKKVGTDALNFTHVNEFIVQKTKEQLQPSTINTMVAVLLQIIRYGERKGCIHHFIYDISKPISVVKELDVLTEAEQTKLVRSIRASISHENIGVLLSLYTGIRLGEICALQWSDIDLNGSMISISKTMQRIQVNTKGSSTKTKIVIDAPKSKKSIRKIPVPNFLLSELKRLSKSCVPNAYILTGTEGKYIEPRNYQYKFKRFLLQTGLRDVHFHVLRHTFATRAIEQGFDVKTLSEILGHASVSFTLDRYVHPSFDLKRQNMEKIAVCF